MAFTSCAGFNDKPYDTRDFVEMRNLGDGYEDIGIVTCHLNREEGVNRLRELSTRKDGYQEWLFIERPKERGSECLWGQTTSQYREINALGFHLVSVRDMPILRLVEKGCSVSYYVTCPDTEIPGEEESENVSIMRAVPCSRDFSRSSFIEAKVRERKGKFGGAHSVGRRTNFKFSARKGYSYGELQKELDTAIRKAATKKELNYQGKIRLVCEALKEREVFLEVEGD